MADSFVADSETIEKGDSFVSDEDLVKFSLRTATGATGTVQKFLPFIGPELDRIQQESAVANAARAISPIQPAQPSIAGAMPADVSNQYVREQLRQAYEPKLEPQTGLTLLRTKAMNLPVIGRAFDPEAGKPVGVVQEEMLPEKLRAPTTALEGIRGGLENVLRGLATPENIALIIGTGGAGEFLKAKEAAAVLANEYEAAAKWATARNMVGKALSGYFGGGLEESARHQYPTIFEPGKTMPQRLQAAVETGGTALMGLGALAHAASPRFTFTEADIRDALTKPTDTGEFFGPPKPRTAEDIMANVPDWVREGLAQKLFGKPLAELTPEQLKRVEADAPKEPEWVKAVQEKREQDAKGIRSDQGPAGEVGRVVEERKGEGGEDIQQPPPGEPEPVGEGEKAEAPKEEVKLRPDPPVPENQFPPLPSGENKLITIRRPDGTTYRAAMNTKTAWPKEMTDALGIESGAAIHRVTVDEKGVPRWSTGMLDKGESIVEEKAPAAPTPPTVEPAPAPPTEPPSEAPPAAEAPPAPKKRGRPKKVKEPTNIPPAPEAPAAPAEPAPPAKPAVSSEFMATLKKTADEARERLKSKGVKFNLGPFGELENIRDYTLIGVHKLAEFGFDKGRWAAEMIKDFGEAIKPHLNKIFAEAYKAFQKFPPEEKAKANEAIADTIGRLSDEIDKLDAGPKTKESKAQRAALSKQLLETIADHPEADAIRDARVRKQLAETAVRAEEASVQETAESIEDKTDAALRKRLTELNDLIDGLSRSNIRPEIRPEWKREWQRQKALITDQLDRRERAAKGAKEFAKATEAQAPGIAITPETAPAEYPPQVAREYLQREIAALDRVEKRTPEQQERLERLKKLDEGIAKRQKPTEAETMAARISRSEQIVQRIEEAGRQAGERIKKRKGTRGTTFSMAGAGDIERFMENVVDLSIIGAAKLARFGLDKARFIKEMRKTFGPWLNAHMDQLYDASIQMLNRFGEKQRAKETPIQQIISEHTGLQTGSKGDLAKTIEALQNALKTIRTIKDHFEGGPKMATAEVKLADDFLEADANKIRESLTQYVQQQLPPSERGRFVRAIANATRRESILTGNPETMYLRAAKVAAAIEDWSVETAKKRLVTRIGDMANAAMRSSGVDIAYKQRIKAIMDDLLLSKPTPATIRRLEAMREFAERMEAQGMDPGIPKEVLSSLDLLAKTPAKDLPLDVLQGIHDQIAMDIQLGRLKVKGRKEAWKIEKDLKVGELAKEETRPWNQRLMQKTIGETPDVATILGNYMRKVQNVGNLIGDMIMPIDALMDMLGAARGKYDGWLFKYIRNPLDLAFNRMLGLRDQLLDPVRDLIKKYNFKPKDGEIIGVYAHNLQEGGRERMINMLIDPSIEIPERPGEASPEYIEARRKATATIDRLLAKMTPRHLEVYREMRRHMDEQLPRVQALMHRLYNIEVRPVENYFPMPRDWAEYKLREPGQPMREPTEGQPIDQRQLGNWQELSRDYGPAPGARAERGFTITRVPNAESAIKVNAFDIYERHAQDVAQLIETQRDLKMAWELTQTPEFKEKYGRDGLEAIQGWLDVYARQGHMSGLHRIPLLDWFRRRTSVGVIGFRLVSNVVHLSNIPFGIQRAGVDHYARAAKEVFTDRGQDFLRQHFRETFERGGGEISIQEAERGPFTKAGFWIARSIDRYNAQATTLGVYMRLLEEKGINPDAYDRIPIDKEAQAQAMILSRRAVASPLAKDVSLSLSRGALTAGNVSIGRTLMQFQNIFQDQWSNIRHDFIRAGLGVGTGHEINPDLAMQMFVAIGAMLFAEAGIRSLGADLSSAVTGSFPKPGKEETLTERAAVDFLRRFPFMSQLMAIARYHDTGIPLVDTAQKIVVEGYHAFTAKTPQAREKAASRAVTGALQAVGVPGAGQAGELISKSL